MDTIKDMINFHSRFVYSSIWSVDGKFADILTNVYPDLSSTTIYEMSKIKTKVCKISNVFDIDLYIGS
jgi:hypothetical protein